MPPRSTSASKPTASAGDGDRDRCTPPLRQKATVSPALAKRKRPTTQTWKEPRRRLDPPSPSKAQKTSAARASRAAPPPTKTSNRGSRPASSNGPSWLPAFQHAARQDKPSRATPEARRYGSTKALVLAAETPARHRGHPSSSRRNMTGTARKEADGMRGLRIPDTPEPEEEPKVEDRKARRSHSKVEGSGNDTGSGGSSSGSCPSSLSSPLPWDCSEGEGEQAAVAAASLIAVPGCAAGATGAAAAAGSEALICSAESDAGSGSESPDLLRSYAMGTKSKSQEPTCVSAGHQGGSGGSDGGTVASKVASGQRASEGSDSGSDSPDLLRAYSAVDSVLEEPKRAAVRAASQQPSHPASLAPSARPDHDFPRTQSCRLGTAKLAVEANTGPVKACRQPIPCAQAGRGGVSSGKRRGTAAAGGSAAARSEEGGDGAGKGEPPVQKRACCGAAGAGEPAGRGARDGSSAEVARTGLLPEREAPKARASDQEGQVRATMSSHAPPKLTAPPPTVRSFVGAGSARGNANAGETRTEKNARSRPPVLNKTSGPATEDGRSSSAGGSAAGLVQVTPAATELQPTPEPSTGDARLAPAGANSCGLKETIPGSAPSGPGRAGISTARSSYHDAPAKGAGLASADAPCNPYAAATAGRAAAAVHNPYGTVAGRLPAGVVVNPYISAGAAPPRGPASSAPFRQAARCPPGAEEGPKAQDDPSQTQSSSGGGSATPPEVRFETARQQLYKNPRSGATMGRGWRGRGRGRGGGRGAGRGGKRGSTAPRPAQDALVGVWRNKPPRKKGERGSR